MNNNKTRLIALIAASSILFGQAFAYSQFFAPLRSVVFAEEANEGANEGTQTVASIIAEAKQELEQRKATNKIVLEDVYQDFYSQYLIGANAAIDLLDSVNTQTASLEEAKQKVQEAYEMEKQSFDATFTDATDTSLLALDTHVRGMITASTSEKVKEKVNQLYTDLQQKIRAAKNLGEQGTITEDMRTRAYQKLGEFEREVLLEELEEQYQQLKADPNNNEAELTKVYEAKKAEIEAININSSGIINKAVDGKENPTMGNFVTTNKNELLAALETAAHEAASSSPSPEEAEADQADLKKLQDFVNDTGYLTDPHSRVNPFSYIQVYQDEYKALVEEGKQILAKDKKTATEVKALNEKFQALVEKLIQSADDRLFLTLTLVRAPLTDQEGLRDYTPSSWKVYKPVLEEALALFENKDAQNTELDAMADKLSEAIQALIPIANFHDLESTLKLWENVPSYTEHYTSNTHPAFVEAYKEAQAVAENKDNDQPTIDNALQKLKDAFDALKTRVSKKANEDAIKQVHHDMGVNGEERKKLDELSRKQYTRESYEPFFRLYDENLALIADTITSNEEENTQRFEAKAQELLTAMNNLQKRAKTKDLQDKIAEAEKKLAEGSFEDEGVKKLQGLIDEAKTLIEDPNAKQTDVDSKGASIDEAMANLVAKIDFSKLDEAIATANKLDKENLTDKSASELEAAIKKAQGLREQKPVTQEEVETAAKELNDVLEALQYKANKDALKQKIDEVKDKDLTDKTDESKKNFEEALEKAKEILAKDDAIQDEVDQALKKLSDADQGLKDKETSPEPGEKPKPGTTEPDPGTVTPDPETPNPVEPTDPDPKDPDAGSPEPGKPVNPEPGESDKPVEPEKPADPSEQVDPAKPADQGSADNSNASQSSTSGAGLSEQSNSEKLDKQAEKQNLASKTQKSSIFKSTLPKTGESTQYSLLAALLGAASLALGGRKIRNSKADN